MLVVPATSLAQADHGRASAERRPDGETDSTGSRSSIETTTPQPHRRPPDRDPARSRGPGRVALAPPLDSGLHGTWRSLVSAPALGAARRKRGAKRRFRRIGATVLHRIRWCLKSRTADPATTD